MVRLAFTLSYAERSLLRGEYNNSITSGGKAPLRPPGGDGNFATLLGHVVELLENTGLFSDEDDVIEMADDEASSAVMLDMNRCVLE